MKFIHTGDFHIGASLRHASFSHDKSLLIRQKEIEQSVYRLLEYVKEKKIPYLFITGDLFDHNHVAISKIERLFKTLSELPTNIFIVIGNHDTFLHNEAFKNIRAYDNIHFLDHTQHLYKQDSVHVYGFSTRDFSETTLLEYNKNLDTSKVNVLCLHGDIMNKQDDHYLTSLKTLELLDFDYIALGHIHKHSFLTDRIAYSGNLEPLDFSETTARGFIEGTLTKPLKKPNFKPFAKRMVHHLDITITETDNEQTFIKKLNAKIDDKKRETDLYRVTIQGEYSQSFELNDVFLDSLKDAFYYLEFKNNAKQALDLQTLKKAYKDTIIETLIETYENDTDNNDSLRLAIRELLATEEGIR